MLLQITRRNHGGFSDRLRVSRLGYYPENLATAKPPLTLPEDFNIKCFGNWGSNRPLLSGVEGREPHLRLQLFRCRSTPE
jgi:hypothetical protein